MTELVIICKTCRSTGSLARLIDCVRPCQRNCSKEYDFEKYTNAYLCWRKGERKWWEIETKTIIGTCPRCLKKGISDGK